MYKAKENFLWYKKGDYITKEDECNCEAWEKKDHVELVKPIKNKINYDINNDGKVDKEDISLMAKKVGKRGGRPKKR